PWQSSIWTRQSTHSGTRRTVLLDGVGRSTRTKTYAANFNRRTSCVRWSTARPCYGATLALSEDAVETAVHAESRAKVIQRQIPMQKIYYRFAEVGGLKISYREAGRREAPTLLLLHGFPSAGHMFRDLIPLLADTFHLVAPDLPGFGQSDLLSRAA